MTPWVKLPFEKRLCATCSRYGVTVDAPPVGSRRFVLAPTRWATWLESSVLAVCPGLVGSLRASPRSIYDVPEPFRKKTQPAPSLALRPTFFGPFSVDRSRVFRSARAAQRVEAKGRRIRPHRCRPETRQEALQSAVTTARRGTGFGLW